MERSSDEVMFVILYESKIIRLNGGVLLKNKVHLPGPCNNGPIKVSIGLHL